MLSPARMNRVREVNPATQTVTAEAGVILQTLRDLADEKRLKCSR